MAALEPRKGSTGTRAGLASPLFAFFWTRLPATSRFAAARSVGSSSGFVKISSAPSFIARTATWRGLSAVRIMIGIKGSVLLSFRSRSMAFPSGST